VFPQGDHTAPPSRLCTAPATPGQSVHCLQTLCSHLRQHRLVRLYVRLVNTNVCACVRVSLVSSHPPHHTQMPPALERTCPTAMLLTRNFRSFYMHLQPRLKCYFAASVSSGIRYDMLFNTCRIHIYICKCKCKCNTHICIHAYTRV